MSFLFTRFDNLQARSLIAEDWEVGDLERFAANASAAAKERLPLGKLARFGSRPSPPDATGKGGGSLRWDGNVVSVSGVECDADDGSMSFTEAAARLDGEGIAFVAHTTARHALQHPRWRIWAPFAKERAPGERRRMISRINGLLGGVLAKESWTLSQAFFVGRVDGVPFEIAVGAGSKHVDEADTLDRGAMPYQAPAGHTQKGGKQPPPDYGQLNDDDLEDLIVTGAHRFGPGCELLRRWAYQEVIQADAEDELRAIFDKVPPAQRDRGWSKDYGAIGRWAQQVFDKVAKAKGTFLQKLIGYLQEDTRWRGAIRRNEFARRIEIVDPFPPYAGQVFDSYRPLVDPDDVIETWLDALANGFPTAGIGNIRHALIAVAKRAGYHPVRKWLDGLVWDQTHRLNKLFLEYFPCAVPEDPGDRDEHVAYYEKIAECFGIGAVARIMSPGCKLDTLPVVIGPQNYGKSRGVAALVPDRAWFSDDVSTVLIDRDTKESLVGKWIIELAEFPHIKKEIERVKAFFSRQSDRYRQAYGYFNSDWDRQCVFFATTNELEFVDVSGNRRFWPAPLARPVDVARIERDHAQIWAEAAHLYRDRQPWWLLPKIETIALKIQASYLEEDFLDRAVSDWLAVHRPDQPHPSNPNKKQCVPFTTTEVISGIGYALRPGTTNVLGFPQTVASKGDQMRIATALKRLGYVRDTYQRMLNGRRDRFWCRP